MAKGPKPMRVVLHGVEYVGLKGAAEAYGVTKNVVRYALNNGREDYLGVGRGNGKRRTENYPARIPVTVGAYTFKSQRACARFLGCGVSVVRRYVRGNDTKDQVLTLLMVAIGKQEREKVKARLQENEEQIFREVSGVFQRSTSRFRVLPENPKKAGSAAPAG